LEKLFKIRASKGWKRAQGTGHRRQSAFPLCCTKAHRFAERLFALPSITLIYKRIGCVIKFHGENIPAIDKISQAAELWRSQWDIVSAEFVHKMLAGDVPVFSPEMLPNYPYSKPSNNGHLFLVLPVNTRLRSFVVHILPYPGTSVGQTTQQYYQKTANILRESNVQIISFANDGNRAHCADQINLLRIYEGLLLARCDIIACSVVIFDPEGAPHQ
jgi:hypothetical protein